MPASLAFRDSVQSQGFLLKVLRKLQEADNIKKFIVEVLEVHFACHLMQSASLVFI